MERENVNYYGILGLYKEDGKENGNYYGILGLYRDDGEENGKQHSLSPPGYSFGFTQGNPDMRLRV